MKKYITLTTILFIVCGLTFTSCMDLYDDGEYKPASNDSATTIDLQIQTNTDLFTMTTGTSTKEFIFRAVSPASGSYTSYKWYKSNQTTNEPIRTDSTYTWDTSTELSGVYRITLIVIDDKGNCYDSTKVYVVNN